MSKTLITLIGFLKRVHTQHKQQRDRPFCFVLGAGASITSGIPAGTAVISQDAPLTTLDAFPEWKKAKPPAEP